MAYKSLREAVLDLEKNGHLIRIKEEVDPHLEMASIHRRVHNNKGPAVYYEKIKGCVFPAVSNLFGTRERSRFLLRHGLSKVDALIRMKASPMDVLKKPKSLIKASQALLHTLPLPSLHSPVLAGQSSINQLPLIQSWPKDGGPFITLPQVYSEDPEKPSLFHSNLGMYRVQMKGNKYRTNQQVGLHYQIQRGIGIQHAKALEKNKTFYISVFIGGPPAHYLSAVMPLPEGLAEILFGGALASRNFRYKRLGPYLVSSDADFCILGKLEKRLLPEGPFGDHLGYYSLQHNFPVMRVEEVYHRKGAIWPFTVVGRPPQEDSFFGSLIHELTASMIPVSIPGLKEMEAVDASGVHPLLLAIGRESHVPYQKTRPSELLTIANAILGFGQASLAKYLCIVASQDNPHLKASETEKFFKHLLERVNWKYDLHFQTCTSMDTLDYTGTGLNQGSRVIISTTGPAIRSLGNSIPHNLKLPKNFSQIHLVLPGILAIKGSKFTSYQKANLEIANLVKTLKNQRSLAKNFPLLIIVDDSKFTSTNINNFLWITFTRSNPASDIYGVNSFVEDKHWGCTGSLLIDARKKPHHAPELETDKKIEKRVDRLGERGKSLFGII